MTISKDKLAIMPTGPGVYLMKNEKAEVVYIGKAKNLKSRIRSYFNGSDSRARIHFLLKEVRDVETVLTENEGQALVLESDLIKKYKPRYNVRLKDDKAHLLVRVDRSSDWPRLELVRFAAKDGADYFGPYPYTSQLRELIEVVKKVIPLRTCSDAILNNRVRPCLEFQIKRCLAPCCYQVSKEEYDALLDQAIEVLEGKNADVLSYLESEMERASSEQRYEDAAILRDRSFLLRKIAEEKPSVQFNLGSSDAFNIFREGSLVEVSVIKVRNGRLFEGESFSFFEAHIEDEELLGQVLSQYYLRQKDFPENILLPFLLDDIQSRESLLSERCGEKVKIIYPKRGDKMRLLKLAEQNAEQNFKASFHGKSRSQEILKELQEVLNLSEIPRSIDCVDVSHFQGDQTVASVVSFVDGLPDRSRYRTFKLSIEGKPDDFASMREVIFRHLSRAVEENTLCDLMLVDGGVAQLSQARAIRSELGLVGPEMISIAKKRAAKNTPERVYVEDSNVEIVLSPTSDVLHLLEKLRDEAHRTAITYHRKLRNQKSFKSELERIPGVGPERKKKLLKEFGSLKRIKEASVEELVERGEIPDKLAQRIASYFGG